MAGQRAFVGRGRELRELAAGLDAAASGRGELLVLVGEPGVGKTRTADEISRGAAERGFRVAWGRCWESGGAPAYWPWTSLLSALDISVSFTASERFELFDEVTKKLRACARERPLLLVLDDLHVADLASLELLLFMVRELRTLSVLVVGTWREERTEARRAVFELLGRIAREGTFLPMQRLPRAEVAALAKALGASLGEPGLDALYAATEGNPLFVEQMVRVAANDVLPGAVPLGIREAVHARLRLLPEDVRALLEIAAVVGREVDASLLMQLSRLRRDEAERRIEIALHAGVATKLADDRIAFSHVLLRDALYDTMAPDRRRALHLAIANLLRPRDGERARVAHHGMAAFDGSDAERMVADVISAAEHSFAMLAFADAAALLGRASVVLDGTRPELLGRVLVELGLAHVRAGDRELARAACTRAAELARTCADGALLARAALALGAEFAPGLVDPALCALLAEALPLVPSSDSALAARVRARFAAARTPAPDPLEPQADARAALALARTLDDDDTLRFVLWCTISTLTSFSEPRELVALNVEMLELAMVAGDDVQAVRTHARLACEFFELGDFERADAHIEACEEVSSRFRDPRRRVLPTLLRAMQANFFERWDEVDRRHAEARALDPEIEKSVLAVPLALQVMLRLLGERRFDDFDRAEVRIRALTGNAPFANYGVDAMRLYRLARAGDRERTAEAVAALTSVHLGIGDISSMLAEGIALVGARDLAEKLSPMLARPSAVTSLGMAGLSLLDVRWRVLGLLAATCGRTEEAVAHYDAAIALLEKVGLPSRVETLKRERSLLAPIAKVTQKSVSGAKSLRPDFELRREGELFALIEGERTTHLKDSIGLQILARLIVEPGREHHVLELLSESDEDLPRSDAGEVLDRTAVAAYRARLDELREELEEAERFHDAGRASRAREEMDFLVAELSRGIGIGGRARRAASASERARINVQRHVSKAIRRIAEVRPEVGRWLEWTVKTGAYCSYEPE